MQKFLWYENVDYARKKNSDLTSSASIRKSLLKRLIDSGHYPEALTLYSSALEVDDSIKGQFESFIIQIGFSQTGEDIVQR